MSRDDDTFNQIISDELGREALEHLDRQIERCREWRALFRREEGREATLHDMAIKFMSEPAQRGPITVALVAALWRLMEES